MAKKNKPKYLSCSIAYINYAAGSLIVAILFLPLFLLSKLVRNSYLPNRILYYGLHFFFQKYLPFTNLIKFDQIEGLEQVKQLSENVIFISNHRGMLDGPILLSLIKDMRPTMKDKYADHPFFRIMQFFQGFIKVDTSSPRGLLKTESSCIETLQSGHLLIFPEGTRRDSERVSDFKKLAFKLSKRSNTPIVPIVIYNDEPFLGKTPGSAFPKKRVNFNIRFLAPIYPDGKSVASITNEAYKAMSRELTSMIKEIRSEVG